MKARDYRRVARACAWQAFVCWLTGNRQRARLYRFMAREWRTIAARRASVEVQS